MNVDFYNRVVSGEPMTHVLAGQSLWQLSGPDRERYLNGQVTQDVAALVEGEAGLAAVCTAKGRMEGSLWIAAHGDAYFLDADPTLRESLGARLEKYLIADDAAFEDISDSWSLSHVFGATAPAAPATGFVIRHARYGPPGHDVWIPGSGAVVVGDRVEDDVVETLRLQNGIPRWGAELTAQTLPPEAGPVMLRALSYTKGCYVGQETIARLKSVGHVNRTLVFLRSAGADVAVPGTKLVAGEKEVGTVTSSGFSPRLGAGIALGYVPTALAADGTVLQAAGVQLTIGQPLGPRVAS
jgi:folate-binding protein YgfZ